LRQLEHVLTFEKLLKARTIGKFEIMSNLIKLNKYLLLEAFKVANSLATLHARTTIFFYEFFGVIICSHFADGPVDRIQRYLDAFESRSIPDGDVVPGLPAP
jgi:hypothetical protein